MRQSWKEESKCACYFRSVCQFCTTSPDPQVNVANARMRGQARRLKAPSDANFKARPSRTGW
eukprot:1634883-Rhodomonas_salina.1